MEKSKKRGAVRLSDIPVKPLSAVKRKNAEENEPLGEYFAEPFSGNGDDKRLPPDEYGGSDPFSPHETPGMIDGDDDTEGGEDRESAGEFDRCLGAAMRILAFGDNSERQMREKLSAKGYSPYEIGLTLALLREKKYVDDSRFIENRARYLARVRLYGRGRIRAELSQKVDRASLERCFEDAMESVSEEVDFAANAAKLAKKYAGKDPEYVRARLAANGYGFAEISYAMRERE